MTRLAPLVLVSSLLAAGCSTQDGAGTCLVSSCVPVATAGTLDTVDIGAKTAHLGVDATLDPQAVMKLVGQELFVLQPTSGRLRIYDPSTFHVKVELPTGDDAHASADSAPSDFYVDPNGRIFVLLAGNDAAFAMAILDRDRPGVLQYIGVPQDPEDRDGKPEPSTIYACDGKLYVTLRNATGTGYLPGKLAIFDHDSLTWRGIIGLAGQNPHDLQATGDDCGDVVVATEADPSAGPDGHANLERFDLDAAGSEGVLFSDEALGGRPTLLANADANENLMYSVISTPAVDATAASARVIAFVPQTSIILGTVAGPFPSIGALAVYAGRVFVGASSGLYIGDANGLPFSATPIVLSGAPDAIALP